MGRPRGLPKTGGRKKGSANKHSAKRKGAIAKAAELVAAALPRAFKGDAHTYLMAIYKDPRQETAIRIDAAKAALPYEKARLTPVEPQRVAADHVPLSERIKMATRRDAIKASEGKVVELAKKPGKPNGHDPTTL